MSLELIVARFDPEANRRWEQRYELQPQLEWSVLQAINHVKDEIDPTLSHRWSCQMGICGSCGMMIDGEPRLACSVFVRDFGPSLRVAPLAHFPVIRDLVIELEGFLERLRSVTPWMVRTHERALEAGPHPQSQAQLEAFHGFSQCINCMLCYSACPVVARDPHFLGPAALAIGHRYNLDSRDDGQGARRERFLEEGGVFTCSYANECSIVCPKHVDPAGAIQQEKLSSVLAWARSLVLPRGAQ